MHTPKHTHKPRPSYRQSTLVCTSAHRQSRLTPPGILGALPRQNTVSEAIMDASSSNAGQQQQVRDVRRVLQVLLPALPPPAIDLACNTFFASTSLNQSQQQQRPPGRFRLRRVDSGQLGNFNVLSPQWGIGRQDKHFCGDDLVFSYSDHIEGAHTGPPAKPSDSK